MTHVGYDGGSGWDTWFFSGVNSNNELWQVGNLTVPTTAWLTDIYVYCAGDGASTTGYLWCQDASSGSYLALSGSQSIGSGSRTFGGQAWQHYALPSAILVTTGQVLRIGIWMDPAKGRVWSTKSIGGGQWDEAYDASAPYVGDTLPSHSVNSGASIGAYAVISEAAPQLSSASATTGHIGDTVTLTGAAFTSVTAVKVNGVTASSFTIVSDTQLSVVIPAGAATGTNSFSVTNAYGTTSGLSWGTLPTISSASVSHGVEGAPVTLTGTGFTGTTAVTFNGTSAGFAITDDSHITTTVPNGATRGPIQVTNATSSANTGAFTIDPTITSFSPTTGGAGASVTITGSGFSGATTVRFNGVSASFTITDHAHINATVPAGASTGTIQVFVPSSGATSASNFNVAAGHTWRSGAWVTDSGDYTWRGGAWVQESNDQTWRTGAWASES